MRLSRVRVRTGFLVGALALLLARPGLTGLLLGVPLALLGEALRVWASGHIDKTQALATGGPYAHCRNPLYLGSLLIALGVALSSASAWVVLATAAYFLAFYPSVMREEAAFLRAKFPAEYGAWAERVPIFLPRLRPGGPRLTRFSWARVRSNREWRTVLSLPAVGALLWARSALGAPWS